MTPVRIGIIGMGGYAAVHHQVVLELETRGEARLVCTCDPNLAAFSVQQEQWSFGRRGVRVFADYEAMLASFHGTLDVLVVPTPIPLHAAMHRAGISAGAAVYLEKPPTLDPAELQEMISQDHAARHATSVGFNFIAEPTRQALKRRMLAGEFGAIRETRLRAQWSRPTSYFRRNGWAGRLLTPGGQLVLDSCFGNAIAHFVHNMLFWAGGPELLSWAEVAAVQAELYRVHAIEGADTFFVEAKSSGGVTMRFALTHASAGPGHQTETVVCERATLTYVLGSVAEIQWGDGRIERVHPAAFDPLVENHREYFRYLRGEIARPTTKLTDCRAFVALNALAYISSEQIHRVPQTCVVSVRNEQEQTDYYEIAGLSAIQDAFLSRGVWPSSVSQWSGPTRTRVTPADMGRLREVVECMAADVARKR